MWLAVNLTTSGLILLERDLQLAILQLIVGFVSARGRMFLSDRPTQRRRPLSRQRSVFFKDRNIAGRLM